MEFVWDRIYCTFRYMAIVLCVLKTITGISCNLVSLPRTLYTDNSLYLRLFSWDAHHIAKFMGPANESSI